MGNDGLALVLEKLGLQPGVVFGIPFFVALKMDFFKAVGRIILSAATLQLLCLRLHSGIISHLAIPAEKKSENFRNLSAAKMTLIGLMETGHTDAFNSFSRFRDSRKFRRIFGFIRPRNLWED